MSDALDVYVPAAKSELRDQVRDGSGISGSSVQGTDRMRTDFEGGALLLPRLAYRVRGADERHTWEGEFGEGYPMRARVFADQDEVVHVGRYDRTRYEVIVEDEERLAQWLGVERIDEDVLVAGPE